MNNEEKTNKTRGRPKKRKRLPVSTAGRKPVSIKKASYSTKWRLAKDVLALVNNNTDILEMAIRVHSKKKKSKPEEEIDEEEIDVKENCSAHSSQTALAFYLENDLNKKSYSALVKDCRSRNAPIYPSYPQLQKEMAQCRPIGCINSEIQIVVPLQQMLNKTVERLCEAVALKWNENHLCDTELHVTMGFDSSSGHVNPHQHCSDPINENLNSQNSLFVSSFIIIKLSCSFCEKCSWINPTPQSVRFCPLRIALEKEDEEATMREYRRLNGEIDALLRHTFQMQNGKIVTAKFIVSQTLFDGKCINTILGNRATMKCPLCDKPTRSFSNLTDDFTPVQTSLKLGLGLLHAEIKSFEHLLHISYRLTIKMWDVKKEFRETMVIQKIKIQKQIYSAIGVRVDQVLQGHGTTNTGNVARRCFKNPIKFAEALELDAALVSNIALIISLFKCKLQLNLNETEKLCWETYKLHYQLYPWARMNPTTHKLLKHSCQIIKEFPLPIAYYSEDANESWHKLYRKNMLQHARQKSRETRILDVFNRATYMTDPKISLIYIEDRLKNKKEQKITGRMIKYISKSEFSEEKKVNDTTASDESDEEVNDTTASDESDSTASDNH